MSTQRTAVRQVTRLGSNTAVNMVNATLAGLKSLKTVEQVSRLRGKTPEEILG